MKTVRAIAMLCALVAPVIVEGHRLDEYLQAARVDISPDLVELSLDLTPGIAIVPKVLADIDRDGDRTISTAEAEAYATRVLNRLSLDVDGYFLTPALAERTFPPVEGLLGGTGTIRMRFVASVPPLDPGRHHLRYQNTNRPDIGVYLANALVPASDRVTITDQRRSANQHELIIDYTLAGEPPARWRYLVGVGLGAAIVLAGWWWFQPARLSSRAGRRPGPQRPAA